MNTMKLDLQSSEINPRREFFLIELLSKLEKEADLMVQQLQAKQTLINQLKYYLPDYLEKQSEDYGDCSCSNYYDS